MKKDQFEDIIKTIQLVNGLSNSRACLAILKEKFPSIAEITLKSIYSQEYLRKMKWSHAHHQARAETYYDRYLTFKHANDTVLVALAEELELAPTLLARLILEQHYERKSKFDENAKATRSYITKFMKDTTLIEDKDLAQQVYMCVLHDDQYGPLSDTINHSLGQQYEYKLARLLKEKQIPFQDEEQMRALGLDKTPDIKLDLPIAVNGSPIHWIESKALYGSEEWHDNFVKKQLSTYWNRYGPGMVIYWFDYTDSIQNIHGKNLLVSNHLPDNIVQMDPSRLSMSLCETFNDGEFSP